MNTEWIWMRAFVNRSETVPVALAPTRAIINARPAPSAAMTPIEETPRRPSISRMAISRRGTKASAPRAPEVSAATRKRSQTASRQWRPADPIGSSAPPGVAEGDHRGHEDVVLGDEREGAGHSPEACAPHADGGDIPWVAADGGRAVERIDEVAVTGVVEDRLGDSHDGRDDRRQAHDVQQAIQVTAIPDQVVAEEGHRDVEEPDLRPDEAHQQRVEQRVEDLDDDQSREQHHGQEREAREDEVLLRLHAPVEEPDVGRDHEEEVLGERGRSGVGVEGDPQQALHGQVDERQDDGEPPRLHADQRGHSQDHDGSRRPRRPGGDEQAQDDSADDGRTNAHAIRPADFDGRRCPGGFDRLAHPG